MSVTTPGPKQSHSTSTPAPFLVQHPKSAGFGSVRNRITHVQPLLPWGAFSIRAFPPFLKLFVAARCDTASGHNVRWSQENQMLDAGSITQKIAAPKNSTFCWSASLPWQSNISESEPQKRFAYLHSSAAMKTVGTTKCFLSSATTIPPLSYPRTMQQRIDQWRRKSLKSRKKWRVKRRGKSH